MMHRVEVINQVRICSCGVIIAIENDEIVVRFDGYNSRHNRRINMSEEGFTETAHCYRKQSGEGLKIVR